MSAVAELIPQVFFDIMARYVPGLVLFGAWILLLGEDGWPTLLNAVAGGHLNVDNALPTAILVLLFVPYVIGYVLAPLAKAVQRGHEQGWWILASRPSRSVYENDRGKRKWRPKYSWALSDKGAGEAYDWLRSNAPGSGALAAKIRAEFTMHNALVVAFFVITVMACVAAEYQWAALSGLVVPLMAYRGASTENTYHSTTRKLYKGAPTPEGKPELREEPRLVWLIWEMNRYRPWEDDKGWLKREDETANAAATTRRKGWLTREAKTVNAAATTPSEGSQAWVVDETAAWHQRDGGGLARKLSSGKGSPFVVRVHRPSLWIAYAALVLLYLVALLAGVLSPLFYSG